MSRKPKKGYFVKGQFVAEGSELDLELKRELKGTSEQSRTDLKRESTELQKLGEGLLTLKADLLERLELTEKMVDAVTEAKRISNFEGKRRQMQFIGKLMRQLEPEKLDDIRTALDEQHTPTALETMALHESEIWRDRLISDDEAVAQWVKLFPQSDIQQLRSLVRQARKDAPPASPAAVSQGLASRHGRAYREIFKLVKEQLSAGALTPETEPVSNSIRD